MFSYSEAVNEVPTTPVTGHQTQTLSTIPGDETKTSQTMFLFLNYIIGGDSL